MNQTSASADTATLDAITDRLKAASRVLFVTGAGISADSGLPTYRGIGGLYEQGTTEDGMAIEEALSGDTFLRNPAITWKHIKQIEAACRGARFNEGHRVIAGLEDYVDELWVLTQNVDGFHHDAGSRRVIEVHGNIHELTCTACRYRTWADDYSHLSELPICPECLEVIRPRVVLFGEELPVPALLQMEEQLSRGFDLVFSVGTTALFPYIAAPVIEARRAGIPTVEINPGESEISPVVDYRLRAGAAQALQALWQRLTDTGPRPASDQGSSGS